MFKFKKTSLLILMFYISIYLPLSFTIYSDTWYYENYESQIVTSVVSEDVVSDATDGLISYFLHKGELDWPWNEKEVIHMSEVRLIYDVMFILGLLSMFLFSYMFKREEVKPLIKINILLLVLLSLCLVNFNFFWDYIFHPLFFSNNLWITTPDDISYYLFPYEFFRNSGIFIILSGIVINVVGYIGLKKN